MPKCPKCGHDVIPRPSLTEVQARQAMAGLEYVARIGQLDEQRANAELLEMIRELWDENAALKTELAALRAGA